MLKKIAQMIKTYQQQMAAPTPQAQPQQQASQQPQAPQDPSQGQQPQLDPLLQQMLQLFSQLPPGAFQQLVMTPDDQLVMATQQGQIPGEITQMLMMLRHGSEQAQQGQAQGGQQ